MEPPKPLTDFRHNSWGFFLDVGNDSTEMFWFDVPYSMIGFLCLGTPMYIRSGSEEQSTCIQANAAARLAAMLQAFLLEDLPAFKRTLTSLEFTWEGQARLLWWGECQQLISGDEAFARELRSKYFETLSEDDARDQEEEICAIRFRAWLRDPDGLGDWLVSALDGQDQSSERSPAVYPSEGSHRNEGGVWRRNG